MSRPADPSWTVGSWATEELYAPGSNPWNSNPIKVPHPSPAGGFVPGQGAGAGYVNYELNRLYATQSTEKVHAQALTTFVGQMPALNVRPSAHGGTSLNWAIVAPVRTGVVLCGNSAAQVFSSDRGGTWNVSTFTGSSGENCVHGDAAPDGSFVVATSTRYAFQLPALGGGAGTRVDVFGSATAGTANARVVYDRVRAKWLWVASSDNSAKTSTNRTTWTSVTSPFNLTFASPCMVAVPSTGTIVYATFNSGNVKVRRTTDTGTTWSTTIDLVMTACDTLSLCVNTDSTLLLAAANNATKATKIWRSSDDGVSWTLVSTLTTSRVKGIAGIGELWVVLLDATNNNADALAYSTDRGATWLNTGSNCTGAQALVAEPGGFIVVASSLAYFSQRVGLPSLGTFT